MFQSARLQLTAWYLLIIMLISVFFSIAFYQSSTRELQRIITRIQLDRQLQEVPAQMRGPTMLFRSAPSLEELQALQRRSLITLIIINGCILVFAGGAGYFLAGRTLKPIKKMMEEQNDFISNASHELRTPLSTLRAEMEGKLLEKHISDAKARLLITSNLEEVSTLQDLTNNLLQLTQVASLHHSSDLQDVSLTDIITTAHKKIAVLAKQKRITISLQVSDAIIRAYPAELTEAFVIIIDNAIKYSPAKTTITVISEKQNDSVSVAISDQGIGIAQKDQEHIFERFYRAEKSRSHDGFGLGLSIAKQIIDRHNGSITLTSRVNHGSTFTISLPLS